MGILHEESQIIADIWSGRLIAFEFGHFLFDAVVDDASRLKAEDELLVTIYAASAPEFSEHLPTQLRLTGISQYLTEHRMRLLTPGRRPTLNRVA